MAPLPSLALVLTVYQWATRPPTLQLIPYSSASLATCLIDHSFLDLGPIGFQRPSNPALSLYRWRNWRPGQFVYNDGIFMENFEISKILSSQKPSEVGSTSVFILISQVRKLMQRSYETCPQVNKHQHLFLDLSSQNILRRNWLFFRFLSIKT